MKWKILYEIFSSVKAFFDFFSNLTWAEENFHPEKKKRAMGGLWKGWMATSRRSLPYGYYWIREARGIERWKKGQVIVITNDFKMLKFFDSFDFSLNFLNFIAVKFSIQ